MSETEKMKIPDAAVEAAANDLYDREGYSTSLADAPQYRKSRFLTLAREVLEAAAPHMRSSREKSFDIPTDADDGPIWWAPANKEDG